jgi:GAF domain-containing protein
MKMFTKTTSSLPAENARRRPAARGAAGAEIATSACWWSRRQIAFSDVDLRLFATFANQAATAISNARLYDEVQKSS